MEKASFNHQVWLGQHSELINLGQVPWLLWIWFVETVSVSETAVFFLKQQKMDSRMVPQQEPRKDAQHESTWSFMFPCAGFPSWGWNYGKECSTFFCDPTKLQEKLNGIHACSNHFRACIKLYWMFLGTNNLTLQGPATSVHWLFMIEIQIPQSNLQIQSIIYWVVVSIFLNFHPWGNDPIWRAYFSDGLVQPPTTVV